MDIFPIILLLFVLAMGLFWFVSLIDCLTGRFPEPSNKVLWFLVIFFLNVLGAALYWVVGRKSKLRTA